MLWLLFIELLRRLAEPLASLSGLARAALHGMALLLGLTLLAAEPTSAAWPAGQKVASGSATVANILASENLLLSAERAGEKSFLSYEIASGSPVAARGTTTLYRAVSTAEHADIAANGALRAGQNSFSTGKWFWESGEHAMQFGTKMDGAGNFRIIEATFPRSVADQFMRLERLDSIGPARFGTFDQLGNPLFRLWPGSP